METSGADYEPVNVGAGKPISILDVASVLLKLYSSTMKTAAEHKFRAGDVRHCSSDISKARKRLGYEPKVSFEEGMRELVAWGQGIQATDRFSEAYKELTSKGLVEG